MEHSPKVCSLHLSRWRWLAVQFLSIAPSVWHPHSTATARLIACGNRYWIWLSQLGICDTWAIDNSNHRWSTYLRFTRNKPNLLIKLITRPHILKPRFAEFSKGGPCLSCRRDVLSWILSRYKQVDSEVELVDNFMIRWEREKEIYIADFTTTGWRGKRDVELCSTCDADC